ncbi:unnamed protein product [Didymodactylos carnosus]|uniref:Pentapeptide repeat-containing protein n=1 Tax=Didymodactylos carnosus TaxID=1234261 RepID=A0A8S2DA21_9BILA|nr:unnamed protein product [Didymodactylos carnosus]CAF3696211.1 unnamed protein product [Didymodactylos carnosus]
MIGVFTIVLAIQQQNIGEKNRQKDLQIADQQQKESILTNFVKEISELLLEKNFSLTQETMARIVRPKALTAIRQLDPTRKSYLIQFLYESKLLSTNGRQLPVDLTDADLNNLNLGNKMFKRLVGFSELYLPETSLINATFTSRILISSDFNNADLTGANFSYSLLGFTNFRKAILDGVDFRYVAVPGVDFTKASMLGTKITEHQLSDALSISNAVLPNGKSGRNKNLLLNVNAEQCTLDGWAIFGSIEAVTTSSRTKNNKCYFSATGGKALMSQIVNVSDDAVKWFRHNKGEIYISAEGDHVLIRITLLNSANKVVQNYTLGPLISEHESKLMYSQRKISSVYNETTTIKTEVIFERSDGLCGEKSQT